jgi:hypothetical protein
VGGSGASCAQPESVEAHLATPDDAALSSLTRDEPTGEAREDLLKIIRCTGDDLGATCERRCEAAGIWCPAGFVHPRNREGGVGDLFQCRGLLGAQSCWYYYESISEKCIRATGGVTLCSEQKERP